MNHHITCVSGYWKIINKHDNKFDTWFYNTLQINCPYIFFCDKNTIEMIKKYRKTLPTYYIECEIKDFVTYKFKDKMITHPVHCPSVELNLIWNEKIFLINKALKVNPFKSDYFHWVDAGICIYRNLRPPSYSFSNNKIELLPKDMFIYSSSNTYNELFVNNKSYYHHISGTSYILHKDIVTTFTNLYEKYLFKLIDKNNIWTDQIVLTHIYKDNKNLFFKLTDGYGEITPMLY